MARSRNRAYTLTSALTISTVLIVAAGTQAWAYTTPAQHYHSQAGKNFIDEENYGIEGQLTSNCLFQPNDNSDFLTQEIWDTSSGTQPNYWVEVGQISGSDPFYSSHTYYSRQWVWADSRPNGGGYSEHFPAPAGSGTFKLEIEWLGGNEWGIYEGGVTGTSTSQPMFTENGSAKAGVEYTATGPAGLTDQGNIHSLESKGTNNVWTLWGNGAAISDHAWISASYAPSLSQVDWNIPCTNAATVTAAAPRVLSAPATPGAAVPARAASALRAAEMSAAAADGDAHPAQMLAVTTTESLGERDATPGDRVSTDLGQAVYLVIMKGNFSVPTMSPKGTETVKGKYLRLTLNPETLQAIDAGISNQAPPTALGHLGPLTNLLRVAG